jgi:integrase
LHVKFAQSLRYQDDNTDTARVRPAGESQQHEQPENHISEALRASGARQRKTIAIFTLDLRGEALVVQEVLGHSDVKTTMIYTHVLNRGPMSVISPLDRLPRRISP